MISRWTGVPIASIREEHATGESSLVGDTPVPASTETQKRLALSVFLCHSSKDKPAVRDLYRRLKDKRVEPWLDEEKLIPGQEWDYEISKAVRSSHVVIVCLSAHSVTKAVTFRGSSGKSWMSLISNPKAQSTSFPSNWRSAQSPADSGVGTGLTFLKQMDLNV